MSLDVSNSIIKGYNLFLMKISKITTNLQKQHGVYYKLHQSIHYGLT